MKELGSREASRWLRTCCKEFADMRNYAARCSATHRIIVDNGVQGPFP